jgi:hypothetical protein
MGNAVRSSRLERVEAPEVVLDGEDIDSTEAGLGGVGADRIGADHGAGAGGVVVEEADGQAVKNAEAVVEAFDLVAGKETTRSALLTDVLNRARSW